MAIPGQGRLERRPAAILAGKLGRREFVKLIGGAAAAWPLEARAQHPRVAIGFLGGADPIGYKAQIEALRVGLRDRGYVNFPPSQKPESLTPHGLT